MPVDLGDPEPDGMLMYADGRPTLRLSLSVFDRVQAHEWVDGHPGPEWDWHSELIARRLVGSPDPACEFLSMLDDWVAKNKAAPWRLLKTDLMEPLYGLSFSHPALLAIAAFAPDGGYGNGWRWRVIAAKNSKTPAVLLEHLAADTEKWVRVALCDNPKLPDRVIVRLAQDELWDVRARLASRRKRLGEDAARILVKDSEPHVVRMLARRREVPEDVREQLLRHPDEQVRRECIAKSTQEQRRLLFDDPVDRIARDARCVYELVEKMEREERSL